MADGEEKGSDFYAVLGLEKECTDSELRNAYKKLALRWHPDRCSAPGNSTFVEEAKKKFQDIQEAYSVLSDANKRLLYDVGAYGSDDDENNGMGEFLDEMAMMMHQTKPNENGQETFEELQNLFDEMFEGDTGSYGSVSHPPSSCSTSSYVSYCESSSSSTKRNCSEMNYEKATLDDPSGFDTHFQSFCLGVESLQDIGEGAAAREGIRAEATGNRRRGRKQKVASVGRILNHPGECRRVTPPPRGIYLLLLGSIVGLAEGGMGLGFKLSLLQFLPCHTISGNGIVSKSSFVILVTH